MESSQDFYQELDLSAGRPLLFLLRQVAGRVRRSEKFRDVGLVRDGKKILIKFYFHVPREEQK